MVLPLTAAQQGKLAYQPVVVPTLTMDALQSMKNRPEIHLIRIRIEKDETAGVLDTSQRAWKQLGNPPDEVSIFVNRYHKYHGNAWIAYCGDDPNVCIELQRLLGDKFSVFVRYVEGTFEAYEGIQHLQGAMEWASRLPGGSEYMRHQHLFDNEDSRRILQPQMSPDEQGLVKEIIEVSPDDATFVEWGMGGTTHMAAKLLRGTQVWHSIEHNQEWVKLVQAGLPQTDGGAQVRLYHIAPHQPYKGREDQESLEVRVVGHYREEIAMGMEAFIFADGTDIVWEGVRGVLVDGLVRGPILTVLATRLQPGTHVIVHDYVGREAWYDWAVRMGGYERIKLVDKSLLLKTTGAASKECNLV